MHLQENVLLYDSCWSVSVCDPLLVNSGKQSFSFHILLEIILTRHHSIIVWPHQQCECEMEQDVALHMYVTACNY